ncbi:sensor histidine kinase [Paenibacillus sp. GCM10023248]|uniref:sensor histidine kinase n=1 Tax=Bacillales TaxID=1385 RepID=UPI0023794E9D|nr:MULTISPECIES: histidine kinase [Bacillales]MDD9271891.1 histidine kinase [Paenibacillus sp. MAHUQ-63]MDR6885215.1 two-component system sensor histidine kinase YesM [Bacillus sp. 3255]
MNTSKIQGSTAKTYRLKYRLILYLFISSLTPLILIGSISYFSMYAILQNKAEGGVKSNLHQVRLSLEETLGQLNHTSQQLAFDGRVGKSLESYLSADLYEKKQLSDEIRSALSLIHFTNPTLGLMFYYFAEDNQKLFENFNVREVDDLNKLPVLIQFDKITYMGPHLSLNPIDGKQVLSILRKVELPDRDDVYVYIETNFKLAESIIKDGDQFGGHLVHLIADQNGRIVYSENPDDFPLGMVYLDNKTNDGLKNKFYMFEETSNQSWKIIAAVPRWVYNQEVNRWMEQFAFFAVLTLTTSCFIAWLIWRTVYRPLNLLNTDIRSVKNNHENFPTRQSQITEFAVIYREFAEMRSRIVELIGEVEQNEKSKALLEVEKLMTQINPHFIHNTLDTIRWVARANGQKEIDRLISSLNKVLHYNLGKGGVARIKDEIDALKNYVELQGIRYNFQFHVNISADAEALELSIPRFIMQPLVENALYHGLEDQGIIEVRVKEDGNMHVMIEVKDNGDGMSQEEIDRLMSGGTEERKVGMGIGLQYVYRMVKFQFGADASFHIHSSIGAGTTISLRLPIPNHPLNKAEDYLHTPLALMRQSSLQKTARR